MPPALRVNFFVCECVNQRQGVTQRTKWLMNNTAAFVDYVRRRKETAERLDVSVRTLDRIPAQALPRVQVTDRIIGFRDSAILRYLDERTRK